MRTRILHFTAIVLALSKTLYAAEIDSITAKKAASAYYYEAYAYIRSIPLETLKPAVLFVLRGDDSTPLLIEAGGYLVISGDDRAYPVLSYSTSESWSNNSWDLLPPASLDFINGYAQQMELLNRGNAVQSEEIKELWDKYLEIEQSKWSHITVRTTGELQTVGNLHWSQDQHYNAMCPETGGIHLVANTIYDNRCPAGGLIIQLFGKSC